MQSSYTYNNYAIYFIISSRTYLVTRNTATNEVVEEKEVKKKCWMYTWKGPETENSNKTIRWGIFQK